MLTDRITVLQATSQELTPEDHFSASLSVIFTDDLRNQHGDADATIVYASPTLGDIKLSLADPSKEESRRLFAHYLWNAGVWAAARIEEASLAYVEPAATGKVVNQEAVWNVKGESVLELGAGLGLTGIVSSRMGAARTIISDYPDPEVLQNIRNNVTANVKPELRESVSVRGHEWGVYPAESDAAATGLARRSFTKIIAADCLWMPWQHQYLAQSMSYYLSDAPHARVLVIAGFHTGRARVVPFFEVVDEEGLEVEEIYEEDVDGVRREWATERDGGREDVTGRKRWLVIAVLKRKASV